MNILESITSPKNMHSFEHIQSTQTHTQRHWQYMYYIL